jgi:GalNAc-alpha-(1->4)-GalNAc-alpha-(1->3)-diNAcBac-PP-undecaprenol alpha-1,4-N-acetyl-D-galactosaminyltransferase
VRILIVVNSLQQGGAERAAVRLAEAFSDDLNEVTLATWSGNRDFYSLSARINRVTLCNFFNFFGFQIRFLRYPISLLGRLISLIRMRKELLSQRPDVVICFEALIGSVTALALVGSKVPLVVSERVNPDPAVYKPHWIAQLLRPKIYSSQAVCSVQTVGFQNWVQNNWKIESTLTPNHIPQSWISNFSSTKIKQKKIISIGRIEPQKGFDNLLDAWNRLGEARSGWTLEIIGSQDNSEYLARLLRDNPQNVQFSLPTLEVVDLLDSATIFVSSSRFEGFPNVVLEALARGVPTIASFSTDIIEKLNGSKALIGYDSEDVEALVTNLRSLMASPETLEKLAIQSLITAKNYTWEVIGPSWYQAINRAIEQKNRKSVELQ